MRNFLLCGLALLVIACEQKRSISTGVKPADARDVKVSQIIRPEPQVVDRSLLGSEVGADGMVSVEKTSFTAGQPIFLTLVLRESPGGLRTTVTWIGPDQKTIRTEQKDMNGAKVATFRFDHPKAKPGRYHVTGYWGGNVAAEKDFDIVAARKAKRKKG
jgi:hypothetical protein